MRVKTYSGQPSSASRGDIVCRRFFYRMNEPLVGCVYHNVSATHQGVCCTTASQVFVGWCCCAFECMHVLLCGRVDACMCGHVMLSTVSFKVRPLECNASAQSRSEYQLFGHEHLLRYIETTIEPDKKGFFGTLPLPLIVLCGGFPRNFVSDLESAHLSGSAHFRGS